MNKTSIALRPLNATRQLKWLRLDMNESQTEFWSRFGVTQSQGSRFEQGMGMPNTVTILLSLYLDLKVSDEDLSHARTRLRDLERDWTAGQFYSDALEAE